MTIKNGIEKTREIAKERIIREIWDLDLKRGDRLPSCSALAKKLGIGGATVFRAVKELQNEGILTSVDKVGFFVEDPQTAGRFSYQIALVIGNSNSSPAANLLTIYLQKICSRLGCRCEMFQSSAELHDTTLVDSLSAHTGLVQQIERGEIQGVLSLIAFSPENADFLKSRKIPYVLCNGVSEEASLVTIVDIASGIRRELEHFRSIGIKRPMGITADCFFGYFKEHKCPVLTYEGDATVEEKVEKLLAMPPQKRPDGLAFTDDLFCQCFYSCLIRKNGTAYLPPAFVLIAKEQYANMNPFPMETHLFTFSMEELAEKCVQLLLKNIRTPSDKKQTECVTVKYFQTSR